MSTSTTEPDEVPAAAALRAAGLDFAVQRHGPVKSLAEAAQARGVRPRDIIKTLVVRRGAEDYLFVLVPGDREISWPKLRAVLGVNRLSLPDAETAFEATGYRRGTITPFGSRHAWPVIADAAIGPGLISLGSGTPGAAISVDAEAALSVLGAQRSDISVAIDA